LTSVTIPANVRVSMSSGMMAGDSFPGNLVYVYPQGGRQAGTYTRSDSNSARWTKQ
jgi:hypothetical protein